MHTSTGLVDKLKDDTQTTELNTIDDAMYSILKPYADQNYRIMLDGNNIQFDAQTDIEECRKELLIYIDIIKQGLTQQP